MNDTTQIKTEIHNKSIEIIEQKMINPHNEETIQMIEPEMMTQIIKETQGIPQERRRSLRKEANRPNRTETPEPKMEAKNPKRNRR